MIEPGDSREQKEAERYLMNSLSKKMGIALEKTSFDLEDSKIELDGFSKSPLVLCEAWAHIGSPKSAQKNKVMADAFKLVFIDTALTKVNGKRILLFADLEAAAPFKGGYLLKDFGKGLGLGVKNQEAVGRPDGQSLEQRVQVDGAHRVKRALQLLFQGFGDIACSDPCLEISFPDIPLNGPALFIHLDFIFEGSQA